MNKALIALSGGVDSSAAACLMRGAGWECAAVTMKLFDAEEGAEGAAVSPKSCCSLSDVNDARDAASALGMPHYVLNFKDAFKEGVIDRFIRVYEEGGTPNPCIDCNRFIKFDALLRRAFALDFDVIVTGHYARAEKSGSRFLLKKGVDARKDQSYVLYTMTQEQLAAARFPLGGLTKEDARRIAREAGLLTACKRESQDICFVPDGDYGAFMERRRGAAYPAGDIVDAAGTPLGRHGGYVKYTIGQRRGLGVGGAGGPRYVTAKNAARNTVTLGPERDLYRSSLTIRGINLIACASLERPLRVAVKTRYLQKEEPAAARQTGPSEIQIEFDRPQRALTPGQAAVLYDGDIVIGGGSIAF